MNTKIGTSFGLAALLAIAAIATMFALGAFTAKPASAAIGTVAMVSTPTTAGATAQHTITVSGNAGAQGAIAVGGTITVTFDSKFTVPSSIASSAVKLKSSKISAGNGAGTADQLVSAGAITVSGRAVTITVPDMDPQTATASLGDNGIAAQSLITITFTQAAGIANPKLAVALNTRTVTVKSSTDTAAVTSSTSSAVTSSVSYTPTTAARGATITVTGKGFTANCDDCKIRMNPQNSVAPTTGNEGSGSIDADGVFTGTIVTDASSNRSSNYIWVVDATGTGQAASTVWVQKAGATPTATSVTPGSTVTSTLVDFTDDNSTWTVQVGTNTSISNTANTLDGDGNTEALTPFKFVMPITTTTGSHKVTITDGGTPAKSATFNIDVVARTLTVSPNPAAIGQSITISGTGFTKDGSISTITGSGTGANLKAGSITVDSAGAWSHTTTMDTIEASAVRTSDSYTITATDSGGLIGTSSGFKRTARTLTASKATAAPGESFEVSVTGMTVNDSENATTAKFTMTISAGTLSGTTEFPVASDGTGTGTLTIPVDATVATLTLTATDNADELNSDASNGRAATTTIKVAAGVVTVDPAEAPTGKVVTVTGSGFPPSTTGSILTFGGASAIPTGGFSADADGAFSFTTEVPASSTGGSLSPGSKIVVAKVGSIQGTTTNFAVPNASITITPAEAAPEDVIVIEGTGFSALAAATTLSIGSASAMPSPAPIAGRSGDITANVTVPLLNPGSYTVVLTNASGFTATGTFKAVAAKAPTAANTDNTEVVFADVIANDDNLVRVWRFSNPDQSWAFYDPRPDFAAANTLAKTGAGDIVWVNVKVEEEFQNATLFTGWNLISLK